jgi:hypothetical protein
MLTEDDIANRLRNGQMTVDQAIDLFRRDDQVLVYPAPNIDRETATWAEMEEETAATASTLPAALAAVGATDEQRMLIGTHIERLRAAGSTWP